MKNKYACPECGGNRIVTCDACGSENDCEDCHGTGLDAQCIDVKAFEEASQALLDSSGSSWEFRDEQGKIIGRTNEKEEKVLYEDFLLKDGNS